MRAATAALSALGLLAPLTSARNDTQLVILHHSGHTGSHALCQLLGTLSCVQASCDELQFDGGEVKRFRLASDRPIALRIYRMKRAHRRGGSGPLDDLKAQKLVRFMPQVRVDLMRWAISEYCKKQTEQGHRGVPAAAKECFEVSDPQFRANSDSGVNTYNVTTLAKIAKVLMQEWRTDSDITHLGFPKELTQFVFYEDLLQAQDGDAHQVERQLEAYGRWILEKLNVKFPKGCHRNFTRLQNDKDVVEKVHSNDIEDFVANADAVRELFDRNFGNEKLWPAWSAVAKEMGVPAALRGHWNRSWHYSIPTRSTLATTAASESGPVHSAGRRRTRSDKVRTVSPLVPTLPFDVIV